MKIFLDTAEIELIKQYANWGIIDGVTTNPSLIAKAGVSFEERVKEICQTITGSVSAEVFATEADAIIKEGLAMSKWAPNVTVKLPTTVNGLQACKALSDQGIDINMILVFTPAQAMLAAKAGARYVSPFLGRLDDIGEDGMEMVANVVNIFNIYGVQTKVLAASVRHPQHFLKAMECGADIVTIPPQLLDKLIKHPLTDEGLDGFLKDAKSAGLYPHRLL